MAREQLKNLTEPMLYILLSLNTERCGVEIIENVKKISSGRVTVGPGTLYALLGRFYEEDIIRMTNFSSRRRTYILTQKGTDILHKECQRIENVNNNIKFVLGGVNDEK